MDMTPEDRVLALAFANPLNALIAGRLEGLDIAEAWLVSGCVFQSVWNGLSGRAPDYGILDYDIFYFDPDVSYEAEDAVIQRCATAFKDVAAEVQVRNQARVHLWYPQKYGRPYPAVASVEGAMRRFLAPACAIGMRIMGGQRRLLAPFGVEDVLNRTIRPTPGLSGPAQQYEAKSVRWKAAWPEITVHPWSAPG
jgi:hypothetical protein